MKQELKKHLARAFEAPAPLRKKEFLGRLPQPQINIYEFVLSQIGYIRKWIWGISVAVFIVSLVVAGLFSTNTVWIISTFTPLLAMTVVAECGRSECYDMAELEMATRFSLKSVFQARLLILGGANLIVLCFLIPVGSWMYGLDLLQTGMYVLTPYMLTAFTGLCIVHRFRGRESVFYYTGAAVCISFSVLIFHGILPQAYQKYHPAWWIAAILLLFAGTIKQILQIINRSEEIV